MTAPMTALKTCDLVAERVALGEPLDDAHAIHAASCTTCQRVIALPALLGATHRDVDPGLGFAARMTGGAQRRLVARRRRRYAGVMAATVATAALAVLVLTRAPAGEPLATTTPTPTTVPTPATRTPTPPTPAIEPAPPSHDAKHARDADVRTLVQLARLDHNARVSARWAHIERPLAGYRTLLAAHHDHAAPAATDAPDSPTGETP